MRIYSLTAACFIFANLASAQQVQMLGEVEVTANKMSENLKNIPQSVSVVDAGEFEERHVKNVEDLVKTIPNINANGGIYEGISSRGLNPSIFTGSNPVALYVGGGPADK